MKHVIIGTAGHVDHGKTMLVKALTGIDTDRLAEEKKRGITIELGFAHLDFADGTQAGIVDVPGHEKFIKNMLAGAGGIDLAMLVVAANEGVMPQTVEHLGILSLLGVRDGLVVITKCDLVESGLVEMVKEDIRTLTAGTFLEGKSIFTVSATTQQGIGELRGALKELIHNSVEKNLRIPFRLPIDRVFSVDGFGTVVTGTLIEGQICEGDLSEILPSGLQARVRQLQVHNTAVPSACAGQRVAVNLAGIKKDDLTRGDTLALPGSLRTSLILYVRLQNLKNSRRTILSGSQVHLYHGTTRHLAKVILLDRDALQPGESCYAQLRMTEAIAAKAGDRFVIRFYSPLETIGGGTILDSHPRKHKRNVLQVLEALTVKESGSGDARLLQLITERGHSLSTPEELSEELNRDAAELTGELNALCATGKLLEPLPGRYMAISVFDRLWHTCRTILDAYHRENPLHAGMRAAELRQKLMKDSDSSEADAILYALCQEGRIKALSDRYALSDFTVRLTNRQGAIRERILQIYLAAGLEGPALAELHPKFAPHERPDCKRVAESLISGGGLVMLTPQLCIHHRIYADICEKTRIYLTDHPTITLAEFRDLLGTSRRYALIVLEYFDKNSILKKEGNARRPGPDFQALCRE